MKKRVEYILTDEEISCVEDIRLAKRELDKRVDEILSEKPEDAHYADFMISISDRLSFALNVLEID